MISVGMPLTRYRDWFLHDDALFDIGIDGERFLVQSGEETDGVSLLSFLNSL